MKRRIACVGDSLGDGGKILPYPGRGCTFGDPVRQAAMIGGKACCEACKSTGTIAKAGGPRRMQPIKTVKVQHTPVEDRAPVKVNLLRPGGTLYWGDAGLDGGYVQPLLDAFRKAGIAHCFAGLTHTASAAMPHGYEFADTLLDAIHSGMLIRSRDDSEWRITGDMAAEALQFNLIGYSYGSLLAAQTAWSYARAGHVIDHLVLVGSPIEAGFLAQLRSHENIRKTIVIDLKQLGDPIYAGMPWRELLESAPMLRAANKTVSSSHDC